MRVVVTGASGNVGTSVLRALADDPAVEEVIGLARRPPALRVPKVEWRRADVETADLETEFRGAGAVVHLAWLIQPGRDEAKLRAVNIDGSRRVFAATAAAAVPALAYASSVGAYRPGDGARRVDESWPTGGIPTSVYSRHKSEVERLLDRFEAEHPGTRVVRMRPGLIFKREAAAEIRRLFAGPFLPGSLLRPGLLPILPIPRGLRFQALHSYCVGDAFRRAVVDDAAQGPFNLAADPVLDAGELGRIFGARAIDMPPRAVRAAAAATFAARLQPSEPGWFDMAMQCPLMDSGRARNVLGWEPRRGADHALLELIEGINAAEGAETPPLSRDTGGPLRARELAGGIGAREIR